MTDLAMQIKDAGESADRLPVDRSNTIRKMRRGDIGQIAKIEAATFLGPWPANYFRDCQAAGHDCFVLESGGVIEAYAVMVVARRVAHLLNLCVREPLRGRGRGRRLLTFMIEAAEGRANGLVLEVRVSNDSAIRLYRSMGFEEIGFRRQYYPTAEGREDALVMFRALAKTP